MITIIKENLLDCIQHTQDDPEINRRCIRFSNMLMNEIAYFPEYLQMNYFKLI